MPLTAGHEREDSDRAPRWTPLAVPGSGWVRGLDAHLARVDGDETGFLPGLRSGSTLVLASDYGGRHAAAEFETLAFVASTTERLREWERARRRVRRACLPHGRRMAFKDLGDRQKRLALGPFLEAADQIEGLLFVVAVERRVRSLFHRDGVSGAPGTSARLYTGEFGPVGERLLRAVHLAGFLAAGLSRAGQDVLWVTDEDEVAPSVAGTRRLCRVLAGVCARYAPHPLGEVHCRTTRQDDRSREMEDLTAVPDLAAGALSEVLGKLPWGNLPDDEQVALSLPARSSEKARFLLDWLGSEQAPLRRLAFVIRGGQGNCELQIARCALPSGSNACP